ncbi:MAG: thiamine-phosphate kinase [Candidatus Aminicenantes bacterium]|nr:thiamine-phosphate kinase [Candidatus Aminicenantes bacterium]
MRLRSLRERDLVAAIRREFPAKNKGLVLGIGDDAAVVRSGRNLSVLTTDLLVEDVHFTALLHPPYYLGRKSLNVNLSDIAAMGVKPRFALLGLALRKGLKTEWVKEFFRGLAGAAKEAGVGLVGGDISSAGKIVISVTVLGEAKALITRRGAHPGDLIFLSGRPGDAAAGLRLLRKGFRLGTNAEADSLLRAFLDPVPQIALGRTLARFRAATGLTDTSDGLSVDLFHLCEESRTGAVVEVDQLPLSPALRSFAKDPTRLALHGGEDYGLLFTVDPRKSGLIDGLRKTFECHWIGRMIRGRGIFIVDRRGRRRILEIKGFEHSL